MKVIVDTCIWSFALRRRETQADEVIAHAAELSELISESRACLIGPVRQELLSGIRSEKQFGELRGRLSGFPDTDIVTEDYERAAGFFNRARSKGIQGSNTDFLICAIADRLGFQVYTVDKDFELYAKHLPVRTYRPRYLQFRR